MREGDVISPSNDQLVLALNKMLVIRQVEERLAAMYLAKKVAGFCHLYIGQEAVAVGAALAMDRRDSYITSYRAHGFMFLQNDDFEQAAVSVIAELLGRSPGCSGGKGGSMHVFDIAHGFYGGHGIVGAQVSLGTGLALAHKYRGDGGVALIFLGDGAVNQGQVYESMNMAALWKLPAIYVIENNCYAMGTAVCRASASSELCRRGECFGIKGVQADGMCILEAYAALKGAVDRCRANSEPAVIEMMTYRYKGHSMSDPGNYRNREEIDSYRKGRDPIDKLKKHIIDGSIMSAAEIKELEKNISLIVDRAAERSESAREPELSELYTHVYAKS